MATDYALGSGVAAAAPGVQPAPSIRRIGLADLRAALAQGWEDLGAQRSDVMVLCLFYPVLGLALSRVALGADVAPLLFPLAAGFALVGPFAATGLYQMSRDREQGLTVSWRNAFAVPSRPGFGALLLLGALLGVLLLLWLQVALGIFHLCMGHEAPASLGAFLHSVFTTGGGWAMIVLGNAVGFLFALAAFCIAVVAAPMLVDDDAPARSAGERLSRAVGTSVRAVAQNSRAMAAWALTVAVLLLLGSLPAFLGLVVVLPLLGHATWHLYRRIVVAP